MSVWPARRSPGPWSAAEARRLARIVRDRKAELVHLHSAKAGLTGRLAVRGRVPTVFQPHAWSWLAARGATRSAALAWERGAARWAHRVVCVSEAEAELGRAAGVRASYEVIPNGVDVGVYAYAGPAEQTEARTRLGLSRGPLVVCVGRLSEQKGQDVLLRAFRGVREAVPGARLALVGDGPLRGRLEARGEEGVSFLGTSRDPQVWLAAADVVALPSRWEGMSMVLLEAMATGRPVVSSAVAGASEALGDDAGEVVPVGDVGALSAALVARLSDPELAAREGAAGRHRAEAEHSLEHTARRMEAAYRAVLEEAQP